MNQRIQHILEETRKLSPEERQDLRDLMDMEFADDASEGTPEEIEAAWMEEVARRIDKAERGETTFVDFDEAIERARQLIRRPG